MKHSDILSEPIGNFLAKQSSVKINSFNPFYTNNGFFVDFGIKFMLTKNSSFSYINNYKNYKYSYVELESKIYKRVYSEKIEKKTLEDIYEKILLLFIFNLLLCPSLFLIPMFFGEEYRKSIEIGAFLFLFKFLVQCTTLMEVIAMSKQQNFFLFLQSIISSKLPCDLINYILL